VDVFIIAKFVYIKDRMQLISGENGAGGLGNIVFEV
jgi:hypothetical protein